MTFLSCKLLSTGHTSSTHKCVRVGAHRLIWRTGALQARTHLSPRVHQVPSRELQRYGPDPSGQLSHTNPDGLKPMSLVRCTEPTPPTAPPKPRGAGVPGREHTAGPNITFPCTTKTPKKLRKSALRNKAGCPGGQKRDTTVAQREVSGDGHVSPRPALPRLQPHALSVASTAQ